jgi:ABC-type transport system involved in multi-copper enzyme maturation permease subunit
MNGLIYKDFVNLKKNVKIFAVMAVLYAVMGFASEDSSFFSSIFTMLVAILTLSAYSYDEMAKWDIYALTMPISRDDIVRGKYSVMLLLSLLGLAICTLFTIGINAILRPEHLFSGITSSLVGAGIVIMFYCIALPFITKLGVEKARLIFFAIYIIPFGIFIFVGNAVKKGDMSIPQELIAFGMRIMKNGYIIFPLLLLLALAISYTISAGLYRKKEF